MPSRRREIPDRRASTPGNAFPGTSRVLPIRIGNPHRLHHTIGQPDSSISKFPATIGFMRNAKQTLDETFLEMRWRALSLAADFDRIERAAGSVAADNRLQKLRDALRIVIESKDNRAEQVQLLFSDQAPNPK